MLTVSIYTPAILNFFSLAKRRTSAFGVDALRVSDGAGWGVRNIFLHWFSELTGAIVAPERELKSAG